MEEEIVRALWEGGVPVVFTVSRTELASLEAPHPLYLICPRASFLGCYISAIREHFGPHVRGPDARVWLESDEFRGCFFEYSLPTGVLSDIFFFRDDGMALRRSVAVKPGEAEMEGEGAGGGRKTEVVVPLPDENLFVYERKKPILGVRLHFSDSEDEILSKVAVSAVTESGVGGSGLSKKKDSPKGPDSPSPGGGFSGLPLGDVLPVLTEKDVEWHYFNTLKKSLYLRFKSTELIMQMDSRSTSSLWKCVKRADIIAIRRLLPFLNITPSPSLSGPPSASAAASASVGSPEKKLPSVVYPLKVIILERDAPRSLGAAAAVDGPPRLRRSFVCVSSDSPEFGLSLSEYFMREFSVNVETDYFVVFHGIVLTGTGSDGSARARPKAGGDDALELDDLSTKLSIGWCCRVGAYPDGFTYFVLHQKPRRYRSD